MNQINFTRSRSRQFSLGGCFIVVVATLLLTATFLAGCANSNRSLQTYYESLLALNFDEGRTNSLQSDLQEAYAGGDDAEALLAMREFLDGMIPIVNEVLVDLRELRPPEEAQRQHQRFVTAFEGLIKAHERAANDIRSADTRFEALRLLLVRVTTAQLDLDDACGDLQKIADTEGLDVDLGCSSFGPPAFASGVPIDARTAPDVAIQSFSYQPSTAV